MIALAVGLGIGVFVGYVAAMMHKGKRIVRVEVGSYEPRLESLESLLSSTGVRPIDRRPN